MGSELNNHNHINHSGRDGASIFTSYVEALSLFSYLSPGTSVNADMFVGLGGSIRRNYKYIINIFVSGIWSSTTTSCC
jgi:hypothetical protein